MDKIAFKPHETRGQEIIKILENMGGVNKYNLDGSKGIIAIEKNYGNCIANDWDILGLMKLGYKIYTLEEYEDELCEKTPSPPTTDFVEEEVGLVDNFSSRWVNEFNLPDGYQFKDENGNVINAQKIVLEKKSPKTDDIIKWLRECDMTKYISVMYSGMCSITFDTEGLIKDLCKTFKK